MIPNLKALDHRLKTLNTHGWELDTSTDTLLAHRETPTGHEHLIIRYEQNNGTLLEIYENTTNTRSDHIHSIFEALDKAETHFKNNPA